MSDAILGVHLNQDSEMRAIRAKPNGFCKSVFAFALACVFSVPMAGDIEPAPKQYADDCIFERDAGFLRAACRKFERQRESSVALRAAIRELPKGADLHNHFTGGVYAETYIESEQRAAEPRCVDVERVAFTACRWWTQDPTVPDFVSNMDGYDELVDSFSVRNHYPGRFGNQSGLHQFFSTFGKFYSPMNAEKAAWHMGHLLRRARNQNLVYAEYMNSRNMYYARQAAQPFAGERMRHDDPPTEQDYERWHRALAEDVEGLGASAEGWFADVAGAFQQRHPELQTCWSGWNGARAEECRFPVRFLAQTVRTYPPAVVFAQIMLAMELIRRSDEVVGMNIVAPENNDIALRFYSAHMQMISWLAKKYEVEDGIALHAGELTMGLVRPDHLRFHIDEAVNVAGATRIGHGVDIAYETNYRALLKKMREQGIFVEINLSSNDQILGVKGVHHPLHFYMDHRVPIGFSTDDEGVSRSSISNEYWRAAYEHGMSFSQLVSASRLSLHHSFLAGESLYASVTAAARRPGVFRFALREECRDPSSEACEAFIAKNEKAWYEIVLLKALRDYARTVR